MDILFGGRSILANRQLPLELISIILHHQERADLLNCRLVCHSWNEECLKILQRKKSGWRLRLDKKSIGKYTKFLQKSKNPRCILPIEFSTQFCISAFPTLRKEVKSLIKILGPNSLKYFVLDADCWTLDDSVTPQTAKNFWELLSIISPGLEELDLSELEIDLPMKKSLAILSHLDKKVPGFQFSCLKSFRSMEEVLDGKPNSRPVFFNAVINACPKLKNLEVKFNPDSFHFWKIPMESLESFRILEFQSNPQFLQLIQAARPILREFHVPGSLINNDSDGTVFRDILKHISPTLESLTLSVPPEFHFEFPPLPKLKNLKVKGKPGLTTNALYERRYTNRSIVFKNISELCINPYTAPSLETLEVSLRLLQNNTNPDSQLPVFPHLRHLSLVSKDVSSTLEFDPNCFPAMETLRIRSDFLFHEQRLEFPTVKELRMVCSSVAFPPLRPNKRLKSPVESEEDTHLRENLASLAELCPVLSTLAFENKPGYKACHVGKFLKRFLYSAAAEGSVGDQLKEIQFINSSHHNCLEKALKEVCSDSASSSTNCVPGMTVWPPVPKQTDKNAAPSGGIHIFNGVQKIRVEPVTAASNKDSPCNSPNKNYRKSPLDFKLVAKYFPRVSELELPARWFNGTNEEDCHLEMETLSSLFPDIMAINRIS